LNSFCTNFSKQTADIQQSNKLVHDSLEKLISQNNEILVNVSKIKNQKIAPLNTVNIAEEI